MEDVAARHRELRLELRRGQRFEARAPVVGDPRDRRVLVKEVVNRTPERSKRRRRIDHRRFRFEQCIAGHRQIGEHLARLGSRHRPYRRAGILHRAL